VAELTGLRNTGPVSDAVEVTCLTSEPVDISVSVHISVIMCFSTFFRMSSLL